MTSQDSGKILVVADDTALLAKAVRAIQAEAPEMEVVAAPRADECVIRQIPGDRRRNSALLMGSLMAGLIPGRMPHFGMPKVKEPHVRHQGDNERARRQKQKDRAEMKAARRGGINVEHDGGY